MRALLVSLTFAAVLLVGAQSARAQYPGQVMQTPPGQTQEAYPPNQGVYLTPQGYGAAQVPPQVVAMQQELAMQQERYASFSLGGPIALMIGGFATFLVSGLFWIGFALDDALRTVPTTRWETTASGVISLVGLALGIGGIGWLVATLGDRAPIGRRIKELKDQLHALGIMANLDLAPLPGGAMVSARFAL